LLPEEKMIEQEELDWNPG